MWSWIENVWGTNDQMNNKGDDERVEILNRIENMPGTDGKMTNRGNDERVKMCIFSRTYASYKW